MKKLLNVCLGIAVLWMVLCTVAVPTRASGTQLGGIESGCGCGRIDEYVCRSKPGRTCTTTIERCMLQNPNNKTCTTPGGSGSKPCSKATTECEGGESRAIQDCS